MKPLSLKTIFLAAPLILAGCKGSTGGLEPDKRPNILIVMGDDISYPHMGAYGTKWVKTPGFDRVARDGILFRNAYTPNAKSSPSRACFLTGRNSWQLEAAANHSPIFPYKFRTFIESLTTHGYFAGYTAKGWAPGIAADSLGTPRLLTGKVFNSRTTKPPTTGISTIDYAANFEDFLEARPGKDPFCFWYGSNEAHRSYEYGSGIRSGGKQLSDVGKVFGFWPDNDLVRTDILDYAYEIEYFDSHLVKMLGILEKRGELDNTIIIVTADNGMPFPKIKGQTYELSNHIPLAIMWGKGIKNPGRTVYDLISFIDIAPTLLEVAGVKQADSGMQPIEGKSITYVFDTKKKGILDKKRDHVLVGRERNDVGRPGDAGYPVRGIVMEGYLYIKNYKHERWPSGNPETGYLDTDGSPVKSLILSLRNTGTSVDYWKKCFGIRPSEELYQLGEDPECLKDLSNNAGYNVLKRRINEVMYNDLLNQDDPRVYGNGDLFDKYPYSQESLRNFYKKFMNGEITRKEAGWVDSTDFEKQ
jgi:N-sulfoglucosamine sulfohydrolase